MFSAEGGAMDIVGKAVDKYEKHFDEVFPLYEYLNITSNDDYDFSVKGSKQLATFIDGRIDIDKPVAIPDDYNDRMY